ncbi:ribosome-associated translation inhibitor RaiA [soil metagenome]
MQTANVNLPITVTGRHVSITESMRDYSTKKVEGLHLDYPRIIEAKVILDVPASHRQYAEIILYCADHITIEADSEAPDIYTAIDETISKIARRMRKYKTRLLAKKQRPRKHQSIRDLEERVYASTPPEDDAAEQEVPEGDLEPVIIHQENYKLRPLFTDEAIMDLELSERAFVAFQNAKTGALSILFRRKDGDYGIIEPDVTPVIEATTTGRNGAAPHANGA